MVTSTVGGRNFKIFYPWDDTKNVHLIIRGAQFLYFFIREMMTQKVFTSTIGGRNF